MRKSFPLVLTFVAFVVSGCVTTPPTEPLATAPDTAAPERDSPVAKVSPTERPESEQAVRNSRASRLQSTSSAALVGMPEPDVAALLGYPRFVREEALARVWQYAAGECVLDLFLYPAVTDPAGYEVVHVEARHSKIIAPVSLKDCFGGLVQTQVSAIEPGRS